MVWACSGGAVENEEIKVLWDVNIKCDNLIEVRQPDIIVIDKKEQKGIIIDIAVPADVRVEKKEKEKVEKYQDLKKEIRRLWKLRNVEIFFSMRVFFHEHSRITGLQGKGNGISLTPHYHFHPRHRHLDISQAITAESSPLQRASSQTRTGNLWFPCSDTCSWKCFCRIW